MAGRLQPRPGNLQVNFPDVEHLEQNIELQNEDIMRGNSANTLFRTGSKNIENVLDTEFELNLEDEKGGRPSEKSNTSGPLISGQGSGGRYGSEGDTAARTGEVLGVSETRWLTCAYCVDHQFFSLFFTLLTMYALFVADMDDLWGDYQSGQTVRVVTSVAFVFFLVELLMQSAGRAKYLCRSYFWLDLVALVSLVPDTIIVTLVLDQQNSALIAGRSSKIARLVRIASHGTKATRLNRLTRIVRVAALIPRLVAICGRARKNEREVKNLLEKKLFHLFAFLDDDSDGYITQEAVEQCMWELKVKLGPKSWKDKGQAGTNMSSLTGASSASALTPTATPTSNPRRPSRDEGDEVDPSSPKSDGSGGGSCGLRSVPGEGIRAEIEASPTEMLGARWSPSGVSGANRFSPAGASSSWSATDSFARTGSAAPTPTGAGGNFLHVGSGHDVSSPTQAAGGSVGGSRDPSPRPTFGTLPSSRVGGSGRMQDTTVMVDYADFKEQILKDDFVEPRLRRACKQQLKRSNNMQRIAARHSEDVGVKVALGVLAMLLVLSIIEPTTYDEKSAFRGLEYLDGHVRHLNDTEADWNNLPVPADIREHVDVYRRGLGRDGVDMDLVYLDLRQQIYCDQLLIDKGCAPHSATSFNWTHRESLGWASSSKALNWTKLRPDDMVYVFMPDYLNDAFIDLSSEERDRQAESFVVLNNRANIEKIALKSIMTTCLVIVLILAGIILLTSDMTHLSRSLLNPLRSLAHDMQSIAHLQFAGLTTNRQLTQPKKQDNGTSELQAINRIFEKMKQAIRSWGKYVPWPVVQTLLNAGVEANMNVKEQEVTCFFSDIASFTSIVESIEPEDSLLLLSRYFNDMSKVIDAHDGIVIEFIGDAILAVYGAPTRNPDHATAGVKATLRMLAALDKMNEWSVSKGLPKVSIRCGVHTGVVLVGNMGFHSRMKYGVVGEDSTIPMRLEELNKTYSTNMLISHDTYERLMPNTFIIRPIDYLRLREHSNAESELVYQVMGRERSGHKSRKLRPICAMHTEAMAKYRAQNFDEAASMFDRVDESLQAVNGVKSDQPAAMFHKRCLHYMKHPPGPGWDGVWDGPSEEK